MIQVLPSWFLSYESSRRYDIVVLTDDILILSLLSRYNALINVGCVTPRFPNNVNNTNNQSIQCKTECHTTFKI